jgi:hypothetical protein
VHKLKFAYVEFTCMLFGPLEAARDEWLEHFNIGCNGFGGDRKHGVINEPSCQPVCIVLGNKF